MDKIIRIPLTNPKANYLAHKEEIDKAIARVLESGRYILGKEVEAFENEFAAYIGVRLGIGVSSGTDALHLALRACGIGAGDEVITVSHTAVATVAAIELCGAAPILVDIDPRTFTIDPNKIESAISKKTKAIIPVHLYGHPADMDTIKKIAGRYGLRMIEDCAQSHGAFYKGSKTGSLGDIAAFSFYPTKNLGAIGDGGMVVTNYPDLAEKVKLMREYGWRKRYISDLPGLNSRLDELQAAILRVKLRYLDEENHKRQSLAKIYEERLSPAKIKLPKCISGATHVYHQYVIRSELRNSLRDFLLERDIDTSIHYPVPIHLQPAYQHRIQCVGSMASTERAVKEILSLPMCAELDSERIRKISELIICWSNDCGQ